MDEIRNNPSTDALDTNSIRDDNPLIQDRTIAALFSDHQQAVQARDALTEAGFDDVSVTQHTETLDGDGAYEARPSHEHGFWESIKDFFSGDDDTHAYGEGVRRGNTLVTLYAEQGRAALAVDILDRFDPIDLEGSEQAWRTDGWSRESARTSYLKSPSYNADRGQSTSAGHNDNNRDEQVIPVVEENLVVGKRDVEGGNVRVRSYVRDIPVHETVMLRQETVNVERRAVDRPLTDEDNAFRERTIQARELNEEAVVGKTARVVEEVLVSKDVSERTEEIDETVRKTEVEVDGTRRDLPRQ